MVISVSVYVCVIFHLFVFSSRIPHLQHIEEEIHEGAASRTPLRYLSQLALVINKHNLCSAAFL